MFKPIDCAGRRRALLPASLVFAPRELKHYRRWQSQTQAYISTKAIGTLPSALEYGAFKAWREQEKRDAEMASPDPLQWSDELFAHLRPDTETPSTESRATRRMRSSCTHDFNVASPENVVDGNECLACIIESHITYMRVLDTILEKAGGLNLPRRKPSPEHEQAFDAWYTGKIDLAQTLCTIQNLEGLDESADEALQLYWATIENSLAAPFEECDKEDLILKRRDSAQLKKVGFTKETNFAEGRDQAYFRKGGPRTEPRDSPIDDEEIEDDGAAEEEEAGTTKGPRVSMDHTEEDVTTAEITSPQSAQPKDGVNVELTIVFGTDSDSEFDDVSDTGFDSDDDSGSDMDEEDDNNNKKDEKEEKDDEDSDEDSDDSDDDDDDSGSDWDVLGSDEDDDIEEDASFIVFG